MKVLKFKNISIYKTLSALYLMIGCISLINQSGDAMVKSSNPTSPKPKFFYGSGGIRIPINNPTNKTPSKITTPTSLPSNPKTNKPSRYFYRNGVKTPIFETSKDISSTNKIKSMIETKITDVKPSKPILPSIDTVKIVSSKYQMPSENAEVTVEKIYIDVTKFKKQNNETKSSIPSTTILTENPAEDKFIATKVPVISVPYTYLSFYKPILQTIPE